MLDNRGFVVDILKCGAAKKYSSLAMVEQTRDGPDLKGDDKTAFLGLCNKNHKKIASASEIKIR
jgi:hypothetical protein